MSDGTALHQRSRLAGALWIEIYFRQAVGNCEMVEARESLVD